MHSFDARTQILGTLGHAGGSANGVRALTVWCKDRMSEASAFFPRRGPTRCKEMAAAFLNMPPRALGHCRFLLQGQRRREENALAREWLQAQDLGPTHTALITTTTIRANIY